MSPSGALRALAILLVAAGCSTTPVDVVARPEGDQPALIAARFRTRPPQEIRLHGPVRAAWFVRVEEGEDPTKGGEVIRSNYWNGGIVYLLNAEPGTYAVVAIEEKSEGQLIPTYLPTDSIRTDTFEVRPGEWTLLGSYVVDQSKDIGDLDEVQLYFRAKAYPPEARRKGFYKVFGGTHEYRALKVYTNRDESTLATQRKQAQAELEDGGWVSPGR